MVARESRYLFLLCLGLVIYTHTYIGVLYLIKSGYPEARFSFWLAFSGWAGVWHRSGGEMLSRWLSGAK